MARMQVQFNAMTTKAKTKTSKAAKAADAPAAPPDLSKAQGPITLAIDIGGSGLKAMLLDAQGKPVSERLRVPTPAVPTPKAVLKALDKIVNPLPGYDRISAGFPGVVKRGTAYLAANMHPLWIGFNLQKAIEQRWKKPARVANDASVQGYGAVKGHGVELTLTFGTGMGGSLFTDGKLCPGLELGHHPWKNNRTYEELLGRKALNKLGKKHWNKLLLEAILQTEKLFNWDHLYIGGGNTKKISFKLPKHVTIVPNTAGLLGGVALWRD